MNSRRLLATMVNYWWVVVLRGVLAVLFGITALLWPGVTLTMLVLLFGGFALADGVFALVLALIGEEAKEQRWWLVLEGLASVAAGGLTFFWSGMTALVLLYFIAVHAIILGILHIVGALELRKELEGEWLLIVSGIAALFFGVGVLIFPAAGALAIITTIGIYAGFVGVMLIGLGWRVRGLRNLTHQQAAEPI